MLVMVLVFTGNEITCPNTDSCNAAGNFTPIGNARYIANATVRYTMPSNRDDPLGLSTCAIAPVSAASNEVITALNICAYPATSA